MLLLTANNAAPTEEQCRTAIGFLERRLEASGVAPTTEIRSEVTEGEGVINISAYGPMFPHGGFDVPDILRQVDSLLEASEDIKNIHVDIYSPGGLFSYGAAFQSKLLAYRRQGLKVTTEGHGLVASAAVLPFIAGDESKMEKGGQVMVHAPLMLALTVVDANDFDPGGMIDKYYAAPLRAAKKAYHEALTLGGVSVKDADAMLVSGDHFFTTTEAKKKGLVGKHPLANATQDTDAHTRANAVLAAYLEAKD